MQMLNASEMTDTRRQVCVLGQGPVGGYCLLFHRKEKTHYDLYYAIHPLSGRAQSLTSAANR